MKFTLDELSAHMTIEKIKILGAVLELSATYSAKPANPPEKWGKWAGLAGLFNW